MNASDDPRRLRAAIQQVFRRFGVLGGDRTPCGQPLAPAHAHALMVLRERGELTQGALGAELGLEKSTMARLAVRMIAADHLERQVDPQDRRVRNLTLTERGLRVAETVTRSSQARFSAVLDGIEPARRKMVLDALDLLLAALPPPAQGPPPDDAPPSPSSLSS